MNHTFLEGVLLGAVIGAVFCFLVVFVFLCYFVQEDSAKKEKEWSDLLEGPETPNDF